MLASFDGYLYLDGNEVLPAVTDPQKAKLVACWAHARRGFIAAESSEKKFAKQAILKIRKLFELEELGKTLASDECQKPRTERAPPQVNVFHARREVTLPKHYPSEPLAKAIEYGLNRSGVLMHKSKLRDSILRTTAMRD